MVNAVVLAKLVVNELTPRQLVYVAVSGEKYIVGFDFDATTGKLTPLSRTELDGSPGPLAANEDGATIYAGLQTMASVQALRVERDGSLTSLGTTAVQLNPVYLALDRSAQHLIMADYRGGIAAVHPLARGVVLPKPKIRLAVGSKPHSVYLDATGRFVFIPLLGDDAILQFRYDGFNGQLKPNDPPKVDAQRGDGPRHLAWHSSGRFVLAGNELSNTLSSYRFDPLTGTLSAAAQVSTLPRSYAGNNSVADIHVTRDGRYVYVSNRGHDSLAGFEVDPQTGGLTPIGYVTTQKTPCAFALDITDSAVIVAGEDTGRLATYRIDHATGKLEPLHIAEVGERPSWVLPMVL